MPSEDMEHSRTGSHNSSTSTNTGSDSPISSPTWLKGDMSKYRGSTSSGKKYNYAYPYVYGGGNVEGRDFIQNKYIKPIPLRITLKGPMSEPFVAIRENVDGASAYGQIRMVSSFSLTANQELTFDAFTNKVTLTTYDESGSVVAVSDAFNSVDKNYQTFLYAKPGQSRFSASINAGEGECRVYYVRYVLS